MPLDPELQHYLEQQKHAPSRSSLNVEQTREMMLRNAALSEPCSPLPKVEDLTVAGCRARQYWPNDDPDLPLTVFFHGGRFFSGAIESHDPICCLLAVFSGSRVLSVDYRLAPEHPFPAAAEDAVAAVSEARQLTHRLAIAGDSAGACLAAVAALHTKDLCAQLLLYPMLDPACSSASHVEFASGFGPGSEDMRRGWQMYRPDIADARATPLAWADVRHAPPALIVTCEFDSLRDEGELYADRLRDAGVDVTLRRYPGVIHGFAGMTSFSRAARCLMVEAGEYLQTQFAERA